MKRIAACVLIAIVSFVALRPLFGAGYFPVHDDVQVERVVEMGKALSQGQFPVRWVGDLGYGYGYPIFNFYAPLPYYAGGVLYALGVPAVTATKLMFAAGMVLPSILLFLALSGVIGTAGAFAAAVVYLYAPYHAVEMYVRGSVGEYWELVFWPLILYGILRIQAPGTRAKAIAVGALGIAGSVLSHTLLGYVTVLFVGAGMLGRFLYGAARGKADYSAVRPVAEMVLLGLMLSAFFWLPAIAEMRYTNVASQIGSTADWKDHFVCAIQLWSSPWGYGGSAPGCVRDGLSFMLGKIHIILAVIGAVLFAIGRRRTGAARTVGAVGLASTAAGVFFALPISAFAWRYLPGFAYLQYPWRFLAVSGFGIAVLTAFAVSAIPGRIWRPLFAAAVVVSVVLYTMKWFVPEYTYLPKTGYFESRTDLEWRASKISDEYLPGTVKKPVRGQEAVSATIVSGDPIRVTPVVDEFAAKTYVVESTGAANIRVGVAAFPGWQYRINDREVTPTIVSGFPEFRVAQGQTVVALQFTDTPVRSIGNILSAGALVFIILSYVRKARR